MLQYDENVVNSQPRRTPRLAKDKGLLNARQPSTAKSSSRRPLGVIPVSLICYYTGLYGV